MNRRRPRVALLPALLATVLATAVAVPVLTPLPAHAVEAADAPAVTVALTGVAPESVSDGQTLTLRGTITVGTIAAQGMHVEVGVGEAVSDRATLTKDLALDTSGDTTTTSEPETVPDVRTPLADCDDCLAGHVTSVAAGRSVAFAVAIPLGTELDRSVVSAYPLIVRISGTAGDEVATVLGSTVSWLPYFPGSVAAPLRVSWVWPLDPAPVLAADGSVTSDGFPSSLATTGTLGAELAGTTAPAGTTAVGDQPGFAPVTYAVEPSLLSAADATAHAGWRRTGDAAGGSGRPASSDSADFLTALGTATRGHGVIALPYADPDAAAVVHAGLALDLTNAISTGASDVAQLLPDAQVLSGVGWAPGSAVDQAEIDAYAAGGATTLVLPGEQLAVPDDAVSPTATAVTTLPSRGPTVRGLVTDPAAEALLADGGHDQPTPAMSAQQLLALLAVIVAEAPNSEGDVRDVVLAVPRGANPSAAWARSLLTATGTATWLRAVPLEQTDADPSAARQPLAEYPTDVRTTELAASSLIGGPTSVATLRQTVAAASSLFDANGAADTTKPLDLALTRAESYAWRDAPGGSAALRADTAQLTRALTGQVALASATTVTLASGKASIPVTVDNGLQHPVTVSLGLSSPDKTKIQPVSRTVTVPAGHKLRVLLPAQVDRAGTFRAMVTLRTPSGEQIGAAPLAVHSKAYGALTLAITFGALGVLVLALLVRGVRRIRHRAAGATP